MHSSTDATPKSAIEVGYPRPLHARSNEPACPKCNPAKIQRKAAKGKHSDKRFWACNNYPQCREIIGID
ncbi:topoisomerase DNA-binding C4 zinc finger domain-containing protein [Novipirellula aureliae]|uniref:topoisomerase DNA-binding C4 zinc finger domain-containing protein n=1 Tax=Novipirellula aureliae TaxID=2527966 RepID=UPI0011B55F96